MQGHRIWWAGKSGALKVACLSFSFVALIKEHGWHWLHVDHASPRLGRRAELTTLETSAALDRPLHHLLLTAMSNLSVTDAGPGL